MQGRGPSSTHAATASWEALGTSAVLRVADAGALAEARTVAQDLLGAVDRACSRFREDSELSAVNRAGGRPRRIGPLLAQALALALRAAELTDGLLDPCIGGALLLLGYDRDWDELRQGGRAVARRRARPRGTVREAWRTIELDVERRSVSVPAGLALDLGATAKAWAADLCAKAAHDVTGAGVLVSLGGDIATAGDAPARGWAVRVTDDHRAEASAPGQTVRIRSGGLATSSTTVRRWLARGRLVHHIVDPRTGQPAAGRWRTASVAAADCADANIASTAAILHGDGAQRWLGATGLPARLVAQDGSVATLGHWPEAEPERRRAA